MAINFGSPISADLMYQYYDQKAITPQIRDALQKRENAAANGEDSSTSSSKYGPSSRVSITDQLIRMNIKNNSATYGQKEETPPAEDSANSATKKPSRYDVSAEVQKAVDAREAEAQKAKDAEMQAIKDKIAAEEEAKKKAEEDAKNGTGTGTTETPAASETPTNPATP
jgi:hypothetical protein